MRCAVAGAILQAAAPLTSWSPPPLARPVRSSAAVASEPASWVARAAEPPILRSRPSIPLANSRAASRNQPECAIECAIAAVTSWHDLAQPGTTAGPPKCRNSRPVAHMGTTWHNVARPGTTTGSRFESCRTQHTPPRTRPRNGQLDAISISGTASVQRSVQLAWSHGGTSWHDVARPGTGPSERWVLQVAVRHARHARRCSIPASWHDLARRGTTWHWSREEMGPATILRILQDPCARPRTPAALGPHARAGARVRRSRPGGWTRWPGRDVGERGRRRGARCRARRSPQLARSWTGASLRGAYILGTGKVPGSSRNKSSSPSSP